MNRMKKVMSTSSKLDKSHLALQEIHKNLVEQDTSEAIYKAIDALADFLIITLRKDTYQQSKHRYLRQLHHQAIAQQQTLTTSSIDTLIKALESRIND